MSGRVRIGVIGTGTLGMHHCRTLALHTPGADLAVVADSRDEAARAAAAIGSETNIATDYRAILNDGSIQAVVITTPNDTHARFVREAAEAGKDIFCEKPLALDMAEADAALEAVASNSVKLQIGFQRRFDPSYREARSALLAGDLGNIELIVGTTRDPAPPPAAYLERSGSLFVDLAIHDYDALRFLTGLEVTDVFSTAATLIGEHTREETARDTAVTTLRMANGALATITNSRRSNYGYDVRMDVSGAKGKLALGEERRTAVRTYTKGRVSHDFVGSYWELFEAAYVAELRHFVKCVAEDTEPEVTGEDGRKALQIALLAERSAQEGRSLSIDELR